MTQRKILVTSALPYANGSIHLGHLVEYIQTDIWVRFQKMQGHDCHYVCADDTHGTPIMLRAEQEGITPKELINRVHGEHYADFSGFNIEFDNYYTTDSPENKVFCEEIYKKLEKKDLIAKRSVEQFYDPVKEMFLPDRFIKGECPKCNAKDQYGDSCEVCGATYSPTELKNPYSVVSGSKPIRKASEHYFFKLSDERCKKFLKDWTRSGTLQPEAANKMGEWFAAGLNDWDISRDAPYFGFPIPGTDNKKFFYVWLDAPVGYMASFKNLCAKKNINFDEYWEKDSQAELYHFIGKDILYFHALFWPAMLEYSDYRKPTKIFAHGFLTVNGEKMSKSRGTFITARSYLDQGLNPEWLRYYYAAKINSTMEDIDLNLDDFVARVNSDLVGKYINIASRCAGFINKGFNGLLEITDPDDVRYSDIHDEFRSGAKKIEKHYDSREYGQAVREIMWLADLVNKYIDDKKPWDMAKQKSNSPELQHVCTVGLNFFYLLTLYLKPILPKLTEHAREFLNIKWANHFWTLPDGHKINEYKHLMTRIDSKQIDALVAANKPTLQSPSTSGRGARGEGNKSKKLPLPESLVDLARKLRKDQTNAEQLIWELLRDRRMHDAKFRRQHPVEVNGKRFILDFYCAEVKLAIELDGSQHQENNIQDKERTAALNTLGILVLRFWNNDVLENTQSVLESIWNILEEKMPTTTSSTPSSPTLRPGGEGSIINIEDFNKIDLRVAKIINAEHIEGAEKLLKLTLDIGTEQRTVFAGIKSAYAPEKLIGRHTVMVANLAPRQMKFGESQGMVLAAGDGKDLFILSPDEGAQAGMKIK